MKKVVLLLMVLLICLIIFIPTMAFAADTSPPLITAPLPAWVWVLIVIGIITFVLLLMFLILPKILALAQKKGWDVSGFLKKAGIWIDKTDQTVEGLIKLGLPINIVDTILDYAATGVKYAEQLWYAGQLPKDQRGDKARDAIYLLLKKAGVPDDTINSEEMKQIIDIGIEAAVDGLGHALPMITGVSIDGKDLNKSA